MALMQQCTRGDGQKPDPRPVSNVPIGPRFAADNNYALKKQTVLERLQGRQARYRPGGFVNHPSGLEVDGSFWL